MSVNQCQQADLNHETNGVQISSRLLVRKGKAMGSDDRRSPQHWNADSPHWQPGDSILSYTSERRRIVAQVRREVPKNRDFFAVGDSLG